MPLSGFDLEDIKSAKKAVWSLSCAILVVSALELKGDSISLAGLSVSTTQPRLVLLLQIFLTAPFIIVFLAWIAETADYLKQSSKTDQRLYEEAYNQLSFPPAVTEKISKYNKPTDRKITITKKDVIKKLHLWAKITYYFRSAMSALSIILHLIVEKFLPRAASIVFPTVALIYPSSLKDTLNHFEPISSIEQNIEQTNTSDKSQPTTTEYQIIPNEPVNTEVIEQKTEQTIPTEPVQPPALEQQVEQPKTEQPVKLPTE